MVIQELDLGILGKDLKAIVYSLEYELMVWLSVCISATVHSE